jgi:hypothetical protein
MAGADQVADKRGTNKSCSAGNKNTHKRSPFYFFFEAVLAASLTSR